MQRIANERNGETVPILESKLPKAKDVTIRQTLLVAAYEAIESASFSVLL